MQVTPLKSIRAKCLDCCGGQTSEVRYCQVNDCPLFTYRFGHNPKRKGIGPSVAGSVEKIVVSGSEV